MNLLDRFFVVLTAGLFSAGVSHSASSSLVYESPAGLVYTGYANEGQANAVNTIPDFSKAGYQGGGVPIPFVPAAVTLGDDGPADDTVRIQNAINTVSALPVGPDGFRGAVLLEAGEYTVSSTLRITTSGVVVRGAGSQESGGTRITYTATTESDVFSVSGGSWPSEIGGTRKDITDAFVPVGARSFHVSNASGYSPGDRIIVQNTVNQQWLDDMSNMSQWGWTVSGYQLTHRYVITAVNGNQITIDAPIVQTIENQYGGGDVYKYNATVLENIGIEAMRIESTYFHIADEDHGRYAVKINALQNGWVRQVTAQYFLQGTVSIDNASQFITVEDCAALDHKSMISGARRYSFNIDDSQYLLIQRCLTRDGRHDYVSGSRTPGPNAFVDCRADNPLADIGPHHRYATGQIYDNIMGGAMNGGKNSRSGGSGHGWTGAQILLWNCNATEIRCDAPNGAMNWCIGSIGAKVADSGGEPFGIWESEGIPVTPRSLYYTQLAERLGTNALNNVILPKQKTGTIWTELHDWSGDGLFLDELIALADEENVPAVGESLAIHGIVRNLTLLDRGAAVAWRKVYGPGAASFADDTDLETTVSFSQDGAYLLEISVDDGITVTKDAVIVQVGSGSPDTTSPVAPLNLVATDNESSVSLDWPDSAEPDLGGYDVFRSTIPGDDGVALAYGLASSEYEDVSAEKGVLYYYSVRAVDTNSNVSARSIEAPSMVNALPTVEIVDPFDAEHVNYGGSLHVKVDASDKGGSIVGVEMFLDDQSVGQDTAAPYEWGTEPLLQNIAVGSHVLKAVATDDKGTSSTNSITITVEVDVTPPAAPAGLFATANFGWVDLDWADNGERDLAGYSVYRTTTPGSYGAPLTNVTDSSYYDLGLAGGTAYYYKVVAFDTNGFVSASSPEVSVVPKKAAPGMTLFGYNNDGWGGFTHSPADATQIWTENIGSVQYRNENTGTQNSSLLKAYALDRSDGKSYLIEGLITLTDGYAEDNNRVGLYLFGDYAQVPNDTEAGALYFCRNFEGDMFSAYEGIQRAPIADAYHGRAKDYSWFGEDLHIAVEFTFNGANIDLTATLTDARGTVTTFSIQVPAADYTGDYFGFVTRSRTREFGFVPPTIKSAPFTMDYQSFWMTSPDGTAPSAPTGLSATPGSSLVTLDWNDNTEDDLNTYSVYRSTISGSYEDVLVSGLASSAYTDHLADNNTTYYYVVTASDYHGNESFKSTQVSATPVDGSDTTPPAAPTGLAAMAGDGMVSLNWDDNVEGDLDSYSVYRSTNSGSYGAVLETNLAASDYIDHSAINGTTYYYVVTATDTSSNESGQSDEVSATPEPATGLSDVTIFGSNNDGLGGFTQSIVTSGNFWTDPIPVDGVEYTTTLNGLYNNSLLKAFALDRSVGKSYTIEGTLTWSAEADRNNRQGIYLFGDTAVVTDENSTGSISIRYHADNDAFEIQENLNGANLATMAPANAPAPDAVFPELRFTFQADIAFINTNGTDQIALTARMIDEFAGFGNYVTNTLSIVLNAADYTGDYFGFAGRTRNDGAGDSVVRYESFSITDNSIPALEGYALWATLWGTNNIGPGINDYELDGLANWIEYALGGNPVSNDAADIMPLWGIASDGGSNWLYYVYNRRAAAPDVTYTVWAGTNLVTGLSNEVPAWSVSPATNGYETATHRIPIDDEPNAFMQLEMELSE